MSVAGDAGCPDACSGERYCTVPMTWPVAVSGTWSAMRAMPKSVILTRPSGVMSRLPGLMSRCTRPAACAACSAAAVCATMSRILSVESDALALEDRRERLAGHELHDEEGAAVLLAVVEDVRDALVVDECGVAGLGAEALEEPGSPRYSSLRILMATVRPMTRSVASHTSPMPPIAIRDSQLVSPTEGEPCVGLICPAPPL